MSDSFVFIVTDDVSAGANPDFYGVFTTREKAQAWIDRQKTRGYSWWDGLIITETPLDDAKDL